VFERPPVIQHSARQSHERGLAEELGRFCQILRHAAAVLEQPPEIANCESAACRGCPLVQVARPSEILRSPLVRVTGAEIIQSYGSAKLGSPFEPIATGLGIFLDALPTLIEQADASHRVIVTALDGFQKPAQCASVIAVDPTALLVEETEDVH